MSDKTVELEFYVDGLRVSGESAKVVADTDLSREEWLSLSEDQREDIVRELWCETVRYSYCVLP